MKSELLKDLYDCFYIPLEFPAQRREIEESRKALTEVLGKPERRLVLQIIDAKDYIIENISIDSFLSGFRLAWRLCEELNNDQNEHLISCRKAREVGARFIFKREEEE